MAWRERTFVKLAVPKQQGTRSHGGPPAVRPRVRCAVCGGGHTRRLSPTRHWCNRCQQGFTPRA